LPVLGDGKLHAAFAHVGKSKPQLKQLCSTSIRKIALNAQR
jgi:hypothetical protein